MDMHRFDTLARSFASGLSRRSMLGRSARAALVSPLALTEMAAYADGNNKKKDKDRNKDKDRTQGQGQVSGPITVDAPGGDAAASAQTVVQTNNQVCAGNCDQTNQQAVDNSLNQAVLAGSPTAALRPPTYWIDLACAFDAPKYRTVCTGAAQGQEGAPLVQKINLPRDGFCAPAAAGGRNHGGQYCRCGRTGAPAPGRRALFPRHQTVALKAAKTPKGTLAAASIPWQSNRW